MIVIMHMLEIDDRPSRILYVENHAEEVLEEAGVGGSFSSLRSRAKFVIPIASRGGITVLGRFLDLLCKTKYC